MSDEETDARITQLQQQQALLTQALAAALEGKWVGAPPSVEAFLYAIDPTLAGSLVLDPPGRAVSDEQLDQLDTQQVLLTDSLRQMLEGKWVGFPSLEADLKALAPGIHLEPHPPAITSEVGPETPPDWLRAFDPDTYMPRQVSSWTCSACALAWVLRATQVDPNASEQSMTEAIGYPQNINATYGLMDGSGAQLQRVLSDYGVPSHQGWLTFNDVYSALHSTTGLMAGGAWYHWVALRGHDGPDLWIANSGPGYKGVYSTLSRDAFQALGPFSVVLLG